MSNLQIYQITNPNDTLVDKVYKLFSDNFSEGVLDPLSDMQHEIAQTREGKHATPYTFLAAVDKDTEEVVGGLAGNSLPDADTAAIAFLAVDPQKRGNGAGKRLVGEYEQIAKGENSKTGRSLYSIIIEAEMPSEHDPTAYDSRPFWDKMGYLVPNGSDYKQPPLEFNTDGTPKYSPIPLAFMIRMLDGADRVSKGTVERLVKSLYSSWYAPDKSEMSAEGYKKACSYVAGMLKEYLQTIKADSNGAVQLKSYVEKKIAEMKMEAGEEEGKEASDEKAEKAKDGAKEEKADAKTSDSESNKGTENQDSSQSDSGSEGAAEGGEASA